MSKQRGKGGQRSHRHKDRRKRCDEAEQHSTKFDEEAFLRDMESALDRMFLYCCFNSVQ